MAPTKLCQSVDLELHVVSAVLFCWRQLDVLHLPLLEFILVTGVLDLLEASLDCHGLRLPLRFLENALIFLGCFICLPRMAFTHSERLVAHVAHPRLRKCVVHLFDEPPLLVVRAGLL